MPLYSFKDKVALVTGAASGMGKATALLFAQSGAKVVVSDRVEADGAETVRQIEAVGGTAVYIPADVTQSDQVEQLVTQTVAQYGSLNFACNAAAIDIERVPLAECEDALFEKIIAINLVGVFYCMKQEIRQMLSQGTGGAIVNIGSVSAYKARNMNNAAYVSSKAGLLGLTRNGALRYARDKIRINTVCPGAIDTPMLATSLAALGVTQDDLAASYGVMGRVGRPEEIAQAVMWLCSDLSSYTVGAIVPVDGGALAS